MEKNGVMDAAGMERMRRILGHRLLNIASGIKAATGYLSEQLDDRMSPRESEYFPLIQQQCDEVSFIVNRMNQLFGRVDLPERLPLKRALDDALISLRDAVPDVEIFCEFPAEESSLFICPRTVTVALEEAVRNARQVSTGPVMLVAELHGGECTLRVIDQGDGFCEESAQHAFDEFFTTRARSMGLGLSIVQKLVQEQGGRVALGKDDDGNYVEFTLPLRESPYEQDV